VADRKPGRQARQLDAALRGLAQIRAHVYDGDREWPDVELVVDDVISEINQLADLAAAPAEPKPAPELAAAMGESRRYREALEQIEKHADHTSGVVRIIAKIAKRALEAK
jgi:hypothetical protein